VPHPNMSLRFRLNLLITLMFLLILSAGALLVIQHARGAVEDETRSTANLTLNLLEVALSRGSAEASPLEAILAHLARFEETRHLHIDLLRPDGTRESGYPETAISRSVQAPNWFVQLVKPPTLRLTRNITARDSYGLQVVIEADPADEISEAWKEARAMLGLLLAFCLLSNGLIYITLGRSLSPISKILTALENIERGEYKTRMPEIDLPELNVIVEKFNHMAEVLERSREQTRLLAQKSLAIQEHERRYLAHELHDELGQSISAIKALAVTIGQRAANEPEIVQSTQTITNTSQRIYDVVRGMMRRLRPVILDELGLVPALQNVIDEWNERHGDAFCRFSSEGDFSTLGDETRINVYRIVQEALTNISKHARASEVSIAISRTVIAAPLVSPWLRIRISDNGEGFDPSHTPTGLGLLGMRERAEALNGRFELVSTPGKGVTIDISLPLEGDPRNVREV
jgi:two-component system, NarL family, sensor histidine kinase UhpB